MIVLNGDKELVRVETWEDITERPGFTDNLDPDAHELSAIIGQYAFADKIHCGLSNCHTPHFRGYLVATKSGQETNIGKDCGKNYFGIDFVEMAEKFDRDMRDKEARERLWNLFFRLDEVKATITSIREGERGADWMQRTSRQLVELGRQVPAAIVRRVSTMLKTGAATLTKEREATAEEREMEEARTGRAIRPPLIVTERIADIAGLQALSEANDLRKILILDLGESIKAFEPLNIDTMTSRDLAKWSKWAGTVEQSIEAARQSMEAGFILLTKANLEPFMQILEKEEERKSFLKYLNSLP
jgi:hypothetical protein